MRDFVGGLALLPQVVCGRRVKEGKVLCNNISGVSGTGQGSALVSSFRSKGQFPRTRTDVDHDAAFMPAIEPVNCDLHRNEFHCPPFLARMLERRYGQALQFAPL
jgi:hypothetical protein